MAYRDAGSSPELEPVVYDCPVLSVPNNEELASDLIADEKSERTKKINKIKKSRMFFDLVSQQVIIGDRELAVSVASGDTPDMLTVGQILASDQPLPPRSTAPYGYKHWSKETAIDYVKWLVKEHRDWSTSPTTLNSKLISRGQKLGMGPSPSWFQAKFGSLAVMYAEARLNHVHKVGLFDDWTLFDFADYLRDVGKKLGRPPTREDIKLSALRNPNKPSHNIIYERFKDRGGFRGAKELAGFLDIEGWERDDYVNWGVRFMKANNGWTPTSRNMVHFSLRKLGPSDKVTSNKFGSIANYQAAVIEAYEKYLAEKRQSLRQIHDDIEAGLLPREMTELSESEDQLLLAAAKYQVMDNYFDEGFQQSKISISIGNRCDKSFVNEVRRVNSAITAGDIELTASLLGVFDTIFPDEREEALKLPADAFARKVRTPRIVLDSSLEAAA